MNFVEISPGVFIGTHMITWFEFMPTMDDPKKIMLSISFVGSEAPGVEVYVESIQEGLEKLGMKAVSNLNLVKP